MSTPNDVLLGQMAVERGLITPDQLRECLEAQQLETAGWISNSDRTLAAPGEGAAGPVVRPLGAILVEKGFLRETDLAALMDARRSAGGAAPGDPLVQAAVEGRFGYFVIRLGLATTEQVEACVRLQAEAIERGESPPPRLGALLVRKGFLDPAKAEEILRLQGKAILSCLGCGTAYNAADYEEGRSYLCPRCGQLLVRPDPLQTLSVAASGLLPALEGGAATPGPGSPRPQSAAPALPRADSLKVVSTLTPLPDAVAAGLRTAGGAPGAAPAGRPFGKYVIQDELGRGGMGVVCRAWQTDLRRTVALKFLTSESSAGPVPGTTPAATDEIRRFYREAQTAARLSHPNIVRIYEVSAVEGRHYLAMEFIEGSPLDRLIRTPIDLPSTGASAGSAPPALSAVPALTSRRAAEILREVAAAVHHAHEQGVIHRDLKPQNILMDAKGRPHVADFGLAKEVDTGSTLTMSGVVVGTPAYLAPEQARGDLRRTGPHSDVYSLGAVLYELLTGSPPFVGANAVETLLKVMNEEPVPPARLRASRRSAGASGVRAPKRDGGLDADLETICLKALEKDPALRYASAEAMAEDLRRCLEGEPILAVPAGPGRKLAKFLARHRREAAVAAVGVLAIAAVAGWSIWSRMSLAREGARQAEAARRAQEGRLAAERETEATKRGAEAEARRREETARAAAAGEASAAARRREAEETERRKAAVAAALARGAGAVDAARKAFAKGDAAALRSALSEAGTAYRAAQREDVALGEPHEGLGRASLLLGEWEPARMEFSLALEREPGRASSLAGLAFALAAEAEGLAENPRMRPAFAGRPILDLPSDWRSDPSDPERAARRARVREAVAGALAARGLSDGEAGMLRGIAAFLDRNYGAAIDAFGAPAADGEWPPVPRLRLCAAVAAGRVPDAAAPGLFPAEAAVLAGAAAFAAGRDDEALAAWDRAIAADAGCGEALLARGLLREFRGDAEGARADLDRIPADRPDLRRPALPGLAKVRLARREADAALAVLDDHGLRQGLSDAEAAVVEGLRGRARLARGEAGPAVEALRSASRRAPGDKALVRFLGDAIEASGDAAAKGGDAVRAQAAYLEAEGILEGEAKARVAVKRAALADRERSDREHEQLVRDAGAALREGRHERAVEAIEQAGRLRPGTPVPPAFAAAYAARAESRRKTGDAAGALADAGRAVELDPARGDGWRVRGSVRIGRRDYAGALEDLAKALAIDPRDAVALNNRCFARIQLQQADAAMADAEAAVAADPKLAEAYYHRGFLKARKGDAAGGEEDITRAIDLGYRTAVAFFNRGSSREKRGDPPGAREDYDRALAADRAFAPAYLARGFLRWEDGDADGAVADWQTAKQLRPEFAAQVDPWIQKAKQE